MKILLVNDCAFENKIMTDILEKMNHECKTSDEISALFDIKSYKPDIVIANLIMKSINGDELIEKINTFHNDMKCILTSSSIEALQKVKCKANAVINTPVNCDKIETALREIIKQKYSDEEESVSDITKNTEVLIDEKKHNNKINFCPGCGEKVSEIINKAKFCPFCGNKFV